MRVRAAILPLVLAFASLAHADVIALGGNFNGTAIAAGSTIWFNSVINPPALSGGPVQLNFTGGTVSFTANSTNYSVALPNAVITWNSAFSTASTAFNSAQNTWVTNLPIGYSGNAFLDGVGFVVPAGGLPGGIHNLQLSFNVTGNAAAASYTFQWQWAAAVYTSFDTDPNSLGVKSVDSNTLDATFHNSDHAGTPEDDKGYVTGGAMGGGGSNYTGSYSPTGSFTPAGVETPEPTSLALLGSGLIGIAGVVRRKVLS